MTSLPDDLQALCIQIDQAEERATALASPLTDEQFHWQPHGGRGWSVAQCLEHLALTNVVYGAAIRGGIENARARGWSVYQPIASTYIGRRFISNMEPPVRLRVRTTGKVRPGSGRSRDEILRMYEEAHDGIRALIGDSAGIDVNRATFANPFVPLVRVRVGTGLRIIAAHDRRHLWQAEQALKAEGFPGHVTPAATSAR